MVVTCRVIILLLSSSKDKTIELYSKLQYLNSRYSGIIITNYTVIIYDKFLKIYFLFYYYLVLSPSHKFHPTYLIITLFFYACY